MDDATIGKFYRMYDENEYVAETEYKPNINTTPQIDIDKRNYTQNDTAQKKVTNNQTNNASNASNAQPNNNSNNSGGKFFINGKPLGDFIKDIIYYNPNNPLDPGNYADAAAVAAVTAEKYAKGPLEKIVVAAGLTVAGVKVKQYLYENFVK